MERHLRRIERDRATGVQGYCFDLKALEVVQPELRIIVARIILGKADLGPSHRFVVPARLLGVREGARPCTETGFQQRFRGGRRRVP